MKTTLWIVLAALLAVGGYWLGSHSSKEEPKSAAQGASAPSGKKVLYYRNPMGLPDTSPVPKKDPMGMDYIPVYEGGEPEKLPAGAVKISPDKVQLLGVRTEPAQERELQRTVHAVGTVQPSERSLYKVAPRFEGWVEKLHVNTTGQAVSRGQVLMEVYSPELVAAQEEYLIALRAEGDLRERLSESALRRLRNWEVSDREIDRLKQSGKPQRTLAYRSPASGVVLAKPGVEGMRFMPGEVLFEIADLSNVWLIAEVSEQDVSFVRTGQEAKVRIASYPGREFNGKVVFVYPTLEAATRTARVRVEMRNPDGLLKPAMYADAEFLSRNRQSAVSVPESAILDSGNRQVVLVQRGEGIFEPRDVKLGMRADGYAEVKEGVKAGEEVVVRANFLIDAESNLKSALGGFSSVQLHRGTGKVTSVDAKAGTVEIEHGPIASLQWPAMSMQFKAKEPSMLERLKPGQAVEFDLSQGAPGEFVIERIGPAGR
ncbi:MAG TPA: efflux RND transporter periplasmic adaptor subunit [Burkholderiales bacterium]